MKLLRVPFIMITIEIIWKMNWLKSKSRLSNDSICLKIVIMILLILFIIIWMSFAHISSDGNSLPMMITTIPRVAHHCYRHHHRSLLLLSLSSSSSSSLPPLRRWWKCKTECKSMYYCNRSAFLSSLKFSVISGAWLCLAFS